MKKSFLIWLVCTLFIHPVIAQSSTSNPAKTIKLNSGVFSGIWKGAEKCNGVSMPMAGITVVTNGPKAVLVSGLYSTEGRLKGVIKGDQVIIDPQKVIDPNFKNMIIGGTLTLGTDKKTLIASFKVLNNAMPDECTATYKK